MMNTRHIAAVTVLLAAAVPVASAVIINVARDRPAAWAWGANDKGDDR